MTFNKLIKLTFIAIIFTTRLVAQESDSTQYNFGDVPEFDTIPAEFATEDAVYVISEKTYSCDFDADYFALLVANQITDIKSYNYNSKYTSYSGLLTFSYHLRIRILTKNGLDEFSFVKIQTEKYADIVKLDARTIKPDGTVHNLERDDIKEVDLTSVNDINDEELSPTKRFAIPGVEVGDEIELFYQVKGHGMLLSEDFYFHTEVPVLQSKLTIRMRAGLYPDLYYYNGAVHASRSVDRIYSVFSWENKNLPGYTNTAHSNMSSELPFVRFIMKQINFKYNLANKKVEIIPDSWDKVFENFQNHYLEEGSRTIHGRYINTKIDEITASNLESSNFAKFVLFFQYVKDSVEVRSLEEWEEDYKPGYYLYKRFSNQLNLYKMYIRAMNMLGINYNLCLAADKTSAQIDTSVVNPFCFKDVIFVLHNGEKSFFLYPSTSLRKYEFDEIPIEFEGTRALVIPNKGKGEEIIFEVLPKGTYIDNFINRRCQLNFHKDTSRVETKVALTLSGAVSTYYRSWIDEKLSDSKKDSTNILNGLFPIKKEEENSLRIDTLYKDSFEIIYPFKYKFSAQGSYNQLTTKLDDSTFSLPLSPIIEHRTVEYSEKERLLNYIPAFPGADMFTYFLVFDSPVHLLNKEAASFDINNKVGTYQLIVEQMNETSLLITSRYLIRTNFISKEDYPQLVEITKAALEAEDVTLLLKY